MTSSWAGELMAASNFISLPQALQRLGFSNHVRAMSFAQEYLRLWAKPFSSSPVPVGLAFGGGLGEVRSLRSSYRRFTEALADRKSPSG